MYYINDNCRILFNEEEKEAYVVNQQEGKSQELPWKFFMFLYYSSVHNVGLDEVKFRDKDQYKRCIDKLYINNVLIQNTSDLNRRFDKCVEQIKYHLLKTVQIEVTNGCNFRCKHCYLGDNNFQNMSLDMIKKIGEDAKRLGVTSIAITGGEPLLHDDIKDILNYLHEKGLYTELYTNGYLLDEKFCDFLRSINIGNVHLSLDGHTEALHDALRNKRGSFKKTISAINYLKKRDIQIVVTCVLSKYTLEYVDEIIEFFESQGLQYKLDFLVEEGYAKQEKNSFSLSFYEYAKCISKMLEIKLGDKKNVLPVRNRFCGSGKEFAYITSRGIVKICPSIADNYSYGEIGKKSLHDMWKDLHKKYIDICCNKLETCEYSGVCCGGCRSRALSIHHDIDAPDTVMCKVLKKLQEEEKKCQKSH